MVLLILANAKANHLPWLDKSFSYLPELTKSYLHVDTTSLNQYSITLKSDSGLFGPQLFFGNKNRLDSMVIFWPHGSKQFTFSAVDESSWQVVKHYKDTLNDTLWVSPEATSWTSHRSDETQFVFQVEGLPQGIDLLVGLGDLQIKWTNAKGQGVHWDFYRGQLTAVYEFNFDKINGTCWVFSPEGHLARESNYKNGWLHGTAKIYQDKTGMLIAKNSYKMGELESPWSTKVESLIYVKIDYVNNKFFFVPHAIAETKENFSVPINKKLFNGALGLITTKKTMKQIYFNTYNPSEHLHKPENKR